MSAEEAEWLSNDPFEMIKDLVIIPYIAVQVITSVISRNNVVFHVGDVLYFKYVSQEKV